MKFGTVTMIVMNCLGLLLGLTFYYLLTSQWLLALIFGVTSGAVGNAYGMWLKLNMKRIVTDMVMEFLKVDEREKKETLSIIEGLKKD